MPFRFFSAISSLSTAFSADFSRDFIFSPTDSNSSSMPFKFFFCHICPFICPPELILLYTQFSGQFIQFLFIVAGQFSSLSQVLVQLLQSYLIIHTLALKDLHLL